jgi:hypothetical protein
MSTTEATAVVVSPGESEHCSGGILLSLLSGLISIRYSREEGGTQDRMSRRSIYPIYLRNCIRCPCGKAIKRGNDFDAVS